MKQSIACAGLVLAVLFVPAFAADEGNAVMVILDLLKVGKLDAAEERFAAALKEFPDSVRVNALHLQLFELNAEAEHWPQAAGHLAAYIDHQFSKMSDLPSAADDIPSLVTVLGRVLEREETYKPTVGLFDRYLKRLQEQAAVKPEQEVTVAIAELTANKIAWLAGHEQADAARALLEKEVAAAAAAFDKDRDDMGAILRLNAALRTQSQVADELSPEKEKAHRERYLAFLTEQARAHPDEVALVGACLNGHLVEIQSLAPTDPDAAEKLVETVKTFIADYKKPKPAVRRRFNIVKQNLEALAPQIEIARAHLALVGKKGAIPEADAWLNGGPLTASDLEGKVVLLDFWAVWCGPCIATFPHLREWHEKFAGKGLVIVGVTNYYGYGWDSENNRIKRERGLSKEMENAATEKFLEFHKLKHRIAVMDEDAKFDERYLVNGIPQAVLIDRQGKVRLIRIGAGSRIAKDLERMIERLIAEPAL
ncbi:MAG: TlpA family protein disulfide reductase [Deltaproteobacteria bacterium]